MGTGVCTLHAFLAATDVDVIRITRVTKHFPRDSFLLSIYPRPSWIKTPQQCFLTLYNNKTTKKIQSGANDGEDKGRSNTVTSVQGSTNGAT